MQTCESLHYIIGFYFHYSYTATGQYCEKDNGCDNFDPAGILIENMAQDVEDIGFELWFTTELSEYKAEPCPVKGSIPTWLNGSLVRKCC